MSLLVEMSFYQFFLYAKFVFGRGLCQLTSFTCFLSMQMHVLGCTIFTLNVCAWRKYENANWTNRFRIYVLVLRIASSTRYLYYTECFTVVIWCSHSFNTLYPKHLVGIDFYFLF